MNERLILERLVRRFLIFPRFLIFVVLFSLAAGALLAASLAGRYQTLTELRRLEQISETAMQNGAGGSSQEFAQIQALLKNAEAAFNSQVIVVGVLAAGLFALGIISTYALARAIVRPMNELRHVVEAINKQLSPLDSQASSQGQLFSKQDDQVRAVIEGLKDGFQDEAAQLAFSTSQLVDRLNSFALESGRRIDERLEIVNQRAELFHVLSEIVHEMSQEAQRENFDRELNRLVDVIAKRLGYYYVGIFLVDPQERHVLLRAGSGDAGRLLRERSFSLRISETSLVGYTAITGEMRVVNSVETDFLYQKDPLLPLTQSEAAIPLLFGAKAIGVFDIQSSSLNFFDVDQQSMLRILADMLSLLLTNHRLEGALTQSTEDAKILYERYIEQSWSVKKIGSLNTGFQYDQLDISPVQKNIEAGLLAELQKGEPIVVSADKENSTRYGLAPGSSALLAPILMYNHLVGVIGLESDAAANLQAAGREADLGARLRKWSKDEIDVIQSLTNQIALALDNARLLDESQQRSTQLRLLQEVTSAAAGHTELSELLDDVTQTLRAGLNLPYCGAILFDPEYQLGQVVAGSSLEPDSVFNTLCNVKWPVQDHPAVQKMQRTGRALYVRQAASNPLTTPVHWILKQVNTLDLLLVPIVHRTRVIGFFDLHFLDSRQSQAGDEEDSEFMRLFDQISLQTSSAVEVALSFEETRQRADRERKIGNIVRHIRETLDIQTILRTTADDIRDAFNLPEVTVRLIEQTDRSPDLSKPQGKNPKRSVNTGNPGAAEISHE